MRKNYFLTLLLTFVLGSTFGQVVLSEDFSYSDGSLVGNGTWVSTSGTAGDLLVSSGQAVVQHGTPSEDVEIPFTSITGSVYAAFDFSVDDLGSPYSGGDNEYFAHLDFRARMDIVPPTAGGDYTVGISSSTSAAQATWATDLTFGQTYRAIIRYDQDTGTAQLWIDATADTDTSISGSADGATTVANFELRQSDSSVNETVRVDNLMIGQTFDDVDTFVAQTNPTLAISSPTNGSTIGYTDTAAVKISVGNFNVAPGGTGDGFIKWTLNSVAQADKFDTNDIAFSSTGGTTYTVYVELVDNAGNPLSTPVNQTVTFTVDFPCDIQIGSITTTCNAETSGVDTYDVSLDFTGGGTTTYTLTADNGTIGGDNPSMMASGTITISNVSEGTDIVFTVKGDVSNSGCDFTRNISSPTCKALPFTESFDYADAAILSDQANWEITSSSSDDILVASGSLDYTGLKASVGNKIVFDGVGSDVATRFTDVTSGTVYASFLFKVTAFQTGSSPDTTDGGYFAIVASNNSFQTRIWVRPNPDTSGTTYDIGFGSESSNPPFSTSTYNLNDVLLIVTSYNVDTREINLWINPDASTFENAAPTATLTSTDGDTTPPSSINSFILRQDSSNETPTIEMDELRIATSWAEVTPKEPTASINQNEIEGFAVYPNPVESKTFKLSSASITTKTVQIFNVLGKEVYSTKVNGTNNDIDVASLNAGIYILKVLENGRMASKKLIIR